MVMKKYAECEIKSADSASECGTDSLLAVVAAATMM